MKQPLHVVFVNSHGIKEEGQDAGGIFKEFLTQLIKTMFDPSYGLFIMTPQNELYPNPGS
jgi:ubiquitin-protein ligase E3 C